MVVGIMFMANCWFGRETQSYQTWHNLTRLDTTWHDWYELFRVVMSYYELLRVLLQVLLRVLLRFVTSCYELLRVVTSCYKLIHLRHDLTQVDTSWYELVRLDTYVVPYKFPHTLLVSWSLCYKKVESACQKVLSAKNHFLRWATTVLRVQNNSVLQK